MNGSSATHPIATSHNDWLIELTRTRHAVRLRAWNTLHHSLPVQARTQDTKDKGSKTWCEQCGSGAWNTLLIIANHARKDTEDKGTSIKRTRSPDMIQRQTRTSLLRGGAAVAGAEVGTSSLARLFSKRTIRCLTLAPRRSP